MNSFVAATTTALALFASGAAMAQAPLDPAFSTDSLVCVATEDGVPIPLGTQVKDQTGENLGSVSITQCSENPGPGRVRVALRLNGDFRIRIISLRGARMDQGQLMLAATSQDVLALAPAPAI